MRAIDADALTEKYGDWYTEEGTEEGFIGSVHQLVDTMPTIEPEPKWIPCSECERKCDKWENSKT